MRWLFGLLVAVALTAAALVAALWGYGWANRSGPHEYAAVTDEDRTRARAYLDAAIPKMPEGWAFSTFRPNPDEPNVSLRVGLVKAPSSKGTVIIVPGYTAPLDLYAGTINAFLGAGYSVAGLEYRGQGRSHRDLDHPEKGYVASYERLGADLAAYVKALKVDGAGDVFVYGNSMGGHVALRAAGDGEKPDVTAYALVAPMVRIETGAFPYSVARGITSFYGMTGLGGEFTLGQTAFHPSRIDWENGNSCNPNPKTAWSRDALFILEPESRVVGTTNDWVRRTMASTDTLTADGYAARIDRPVLMFTAEKETFVNSDTAAAMCSAIDSGPGTCTRHHYPEASHCLVQESTTVRDDLYTRAIRFFEENGTH